MRASKRPVPRRGKPERVTWKQMTVRLPPEVHTALKVRAAEEGTAMSEIIEGLVRKYLVNGAKS